MKTKIIPVLEILAGVMFISLISSDIQLGFGLVLLFNGLKSLIK